MARAHHRAATPLERIERQHRQRPVQRRDDLAFGNLAAAADDVAPGGIARDGALNAVGVHHRQQPRRLAARLERRVARRVQRSGDTSGKVFGDGGRRSEAGRVDASRIEESRCAFGLSHDEIARGARCAHSGEIGDHAARRGGRPRSPRFIENEAESLGRRAQAVLGILGKGVGADEKVAVNRRRDENALSERAGHLKNRMVKRLAQSGLI